MSTKIDYARIFKKETRLKRSFDKSHPDSLIEAVSYSAFDHMLNSSDYEAVSPNVKPGRGSRASDVGRYINRLLANNGVEDLVHLLVRNYMSEADFRDGAERLLAWDMIRWFPRHKEIAEGFVSRHGRKQQ